MNVHELYAGWFVFDLNLAVLLVVLSVAISVLLVAVAIRNRKWHEYFTLLVALTVIVFVLGSVLLQTVFGFPIFVERHFFPLP